MNTAIPMNPLDQVKLHFSPDSLFVLNICLGFIMFGVALELKPSHFKQVFTHPRSVGWGVFSQFLLLPALTFLLVYLIKPMPSIALGMILVAACPGGNISNFISLLAGGNAALSVSLTAMATILAMFMTPLNFAFWGSMLPETQGVLTEVSLNHWDMLKTVALLLGLPLILGMTFAWKWPDITQKINKPIRILSILIFAGFVIIAFFNNVAYFTQYIGYVVWLVLIHNGIALASGYFLGRLTRLSEPDRRTLAIETGIQNSGLGLILIFNFFDGLGGMAIVAAWWGIWHILSGLSLAGLWSKYGKQKLS